MSINVKIWFDAMKKLGLKGLKVTNCHVFLDASFSGSRGVN